MNEILGIIPPLLPRTSVLTDPLFVLLLLDGQHVGGLFCAVLEARVQSGVLEHDVGDVQ